jgi:bacterioferritin
MSNKEQLIQGMQAIVTGLSQQADGHMIQSRIFAAQGYTKLADKYAEHAEEERGYVTKLIDRILDLGGCVKNEAKQEMPVCYDPVDWVKADLKISVDGLTSIKPLVEMSRGDYITFDILKDYYADEEEDMYWGEAQLELIEKIGVQNWLVQQL